MAFYGLLIWLVCYEKDKLQRWTVRPVSGVIIMIGVSRIYLCPRLPTSLVVSRQSLVALVLFTLMIPSLIYKKKAPRRRQTNNLCADYLIASSSTHVSHSCLTTARVGFLDSLQAYWSTHHAVQKAYAYGHKWQYCDNQVKPLAIMTYPSHSETSCKEIIFSLPYGAIVEVESLLRPGKLNGGTFCSV